VQGLVDEVRAVSAAADLDTAVSAYYRTRARVRELHEAWTIAQRFASDLAGELVAALDDHDRAADRLVIAEDLAAREDGACTPPSSS
jgi:hypothetical protein